MTATQTKEMLEYVVGDILTYFYENIIALELEANINKELFEEFIKEQNVLSNKNEELLNTLKKIIEHL